MKITVLAENQMGFGAQKTRVIEACSAEWGLSLFIETGSINLLFDSGHSNIYKDNAKHLGVDLNTTDFVILSHHHWDHAKGLLNHEFTEKKKLILHPEVINKVSSEDSDLFKRDFDVVQSKEPLEFSPDVYFLGQIPRTTTFEKGALNNDEMLDDTAIAIKTNEGAVIITGCSHAGVVNISEYARKVTGQKIRAVIGGFHLFEDDPDAVEGAIDYFKTKNPTHIFPMHCIDLASLVKFYNALPVTKYGTGDIIELN